MIDIVDQHQSSGSEQHPQRRDQQHVVAAREIDSRQRADQDIEQHPHQCAHGNRTAACAAHDGVEKIEPPCVAKRLGQRCHRRAGLGQCRGHAPERRQDERAHHRPIRQAAQFAAAQLPDSQRNERACGNDPAPEGQLSQRAPAGQSTTRRVWSRISRSRKGV